MRQFRVLLLACVALFGLSARGFPFQILNNGCEDFTAAPSAQVRACTDFLRADFSVIIWHALMMRSAAYFRAGDTENARSGYAQAVGYILKNNGFSREGDWFGAVCWTYGVLNDTKDAAPYCADGMRMEPQNPTLLASRGLLEVRSGDFQQAEADFDSALHRPLALRITAEFGIDRRRYALFGRGIAKLRLGDIQGGKVDIAAAEDLKPGTALEFRLYGITPEP